MFSLKFQSAPGSIGQVRESATQCCLRRRTEHPDVPRRPGRRKAAGRPKALEHHRDTVLYFEGEKHHSHRIIRAVKNRFGAVSELGVFEMTGTGLRAVPNPSRLFLSERPAGAPGSAVLCCVEGSRPLLVEVQALVSTSSYGNARRMASGLDHNRLSLLLAVMEKRAGMNLVAEDVFVNIAGGMAVDEPAADLAIVAAVASSMRNRPVKAGTAVFGEVGLAGEIRGTSQASLRVREAPDGFTHLRRARRNCAPTKCRQAWSRRRETVSEALDQLWTGKTTIERPWLVPPGRALFVLAVTYAAVLVGRSARPRGSTSPSGVLPGLIFVLVESACDPRRSRISSRAHRWRIGLGLSKTIGADALSGRTRATAGSSSAQHHHPPGSRISAS